MIVGEGRAGKTAFSRSIIGDKFAETDSTIGIHQFSCVVNQMSASGSASSWSKSTGRAKEYESAIARNMKQAKDDARNKKEKSILDSSSLRESRQVDEIDNKPAFHATSGVDAHHMGETPEKSSLVDVATTSESGTSSLTLATALDNEQATTSTSSNDHDDDYNNGEEQNIETIGKRQLDEDVIAKCLANEIETSSSIHISVFDYGGQEVFTAIHHLFLTAYGVYALCFNMEWLVAKDEAEKERCLKYLKFWIDSIYMHTYSIKSDRCAPFILIGTHKDKVVRSDQHHDVDHILNEAFKSSGAWCSKLENKEGRGKDDARTNLCFFAVDNKLGREDPVLMQAMSCMETAMEEAEYTHTKVPLEWLAFIDSLRETKKSFFELSDFTAIAMKCGVQRQHIPLILRFLHEMGMCMYNDEPALKDLVIMDAIDYLVTPASRVICNHSGQGDDKTRHVLPEGIMSEVNKSSYRPKWQELVNEGILSTSLLPLIWKDFQLAQSEVDRLLSLMTQYGLLVPLVSDDESEGDIRYVVPSLLPICNDPDFYDVKGKWGDESEASTCYFFFTLSKAFENKPELNCAHLKENGFCPSGLYERLVGKIIMWTQATSMDGKFNPDDVALFKEVSILSFGSRCFRLSASQALRRLNCLRVDVQGSDPLVIVQKLTELIEHVIKESMKGLSVMLLLPRLNGTRTNLECIRQLEQNHDFNSSSLLSLVAIKDAVKSNNGLKHKAKTIISFDDLKRYYASWLQVYSAKDRYDMFISYRWGDDDKPLARQIFDAMSNHKLDDRAIDVFLDVCRLKDGEQFDKEFARALINSKVILPLITMDCVARFRSHTGKLVDNVLLEWILAHECKQANSHDINLSLVQFVFPVYVGHRKKSNESNSLHIEPFDFNLYSQLSDEVPVATIAKAKQILIANGIETFSGQFETWTVRSFMAEFMSYKGIVASECKQHRRLVSVIASDVFGNILAQANYSRPPSRVAKKLREEVISASAVSNDNNGDSSNVGSSLRSDREVDAGRYNKAYEILMNKDNCRKNQFETLHEYLDEELGVTSGEKLMKTRKEWHEKIAEHLKGVPRDEYLSLISNP